MEKTLFRKEVPETMCWWSTWPEHNQSWIELNIDINRWRCIIINMISFSRAVKSVKGPSFCSQHKKQSVLQTMRWFQTCAISPCRAWAVSPHPLRAGLLITTLMISDDDTMVLWSHFCRKIGTVPSFECNFVQRNWYLARIAIFWVQFPVVLHRMSCSCCHWTSSKHFSENWILRFRFLLLLFLLIIDNCQLIKFFHIWYAPWRNVIYQYL